MYKNSYMTASSIADEIRKSSETTKSYSGPPKALGLGGRIVKAADTVDTSKGLRAKSPQPGGIPKDPTYYSDMNAAYMSVFREMDETPSLDYFQGQDIDSTEDSIQDQANRLVDSSEATFEYPTGAKDVTGLGTLLSFVTSGESYGGSLDAANRGTVGKKIIGSEKTAKRGGKKVSEMTLGEIKKFQKIKNPNNPNRLFAVGAFQIIPDTLIEAQKATGLPDSAVFNRETQEKLGKYLLNGKANTRSLIKWLNDEEGVTIEDAMYGLAREFASMPLPYNANGKKAGQSYYGSGNTAKHSIQKVKALLNGVKSSMKGGS